MSWWKRLGYHWSQNGWGWSGWEHNGERGKSSNGKRKTWEGADFLKNKKLIKPRKPEKNNRKNRTVKKNRLNRLKFWKNRPVRFGFGFISLKTEKPNRNEPKPKTNRAKLVWTFFCPKKTKSNLNWSVWTGFSFFKKNYSLVTFFWQKPNRIENDHS